MKKRVVSAKYHGQSWAVSFLAKYLSLYVYFVAQGDFFAAICSCACDVDLFFIFEVNFLLFRLLKCMICISLL